MVLDSLLSKLVFGLIESQNWHEHKIVLKFKGKKNQTGNGFQVRNLTVETVNQKSVFYKSPADLNTETKNDVSWRAKRNRFIKKDIDDAEAED